MLNISIEQAINVWAQLEDAYHNCNCYGGDTAEIYAYTLMPYEPIYIHAIKNGRRYESEILNEAFDECEANAANALYVMLKLFAKKRECKIMVDDKKLGSWLLKERRLHRWHVKVIHDQQK